MKAFRNVKGTLYAMNPNYDYEQCLALQAPQCMEAVGHRSGERMWTDWQKMTVELERRLEISETSLLRKHKLKRLNDRLELTQLLRGRAGLESVLLIPSLLSSY